MIGAVEATWSLEPLPLALSAQAFVRLTLCVDGATSAPMIRTTTPPSAVD
jgi:hypothetical protein